MRKRMAAVVSAAALVASALVSGPASAGGPTFTDSLVTAISAPTALAFMPNGKLLITTQGGTIRGFKKGVFKAPNFTLSPICTNSERGLLGVAVDPDFVTTRFIFLYYTANKSGTCVNRVSRFYLPAGGNPINETILLDNIPSPGGSHNAGDLQFTPQKKLYVSVGDGGVDLNTGGTQNSNGNARRLDIPLGKILRIKRNGNVPLNNPYADDPGARFCSDPAGVPGGSGPCKEIFATGLRNPFRIAVQPGTGVWHINDVGTANWEEIDRGAKARDYGFNLREGPCPAGQGPGPGCTANTDPGLTDPIYAYDSTGACDTITGGAFVPTDIGWPSDYSGRYLYGDFGCGQIFRLSASAPYSATSVFSNVGSITHTAFGASPDGGMDLYYARYTNGGEVRRIHFTP